jgi:glucose/mannose transport system permease protein
VRLPAGRLTGQPVRAAAGMRGESMHIKRDKIFAVLVLLPSLILVGVFVYGFIGRTAYISLSDWGKEAALAENPEIKLIGLETYRELFTSFTDARFRQDLVNAVFYSLLLIAGAIAVGILLAILLDRKPKGLSVYRTLFLYPMALSFIVSGTIWRWMMSPQGGINLVPTLFGLDRFEFQWLSSRQSVLQFNWQDLPLVLGGMILVVLGIVTVLQWRKDNRKTALPLTLISALLLVWLVFGKSLGLVPSALGYEEMHGFNLAIIGVIIAAIWQYSGYTMALYYAGLRGLPVEVHESAKIDGATESQYYFRVAIPMLRTTTFSAIIILAHISLKLFALIFAMTGPDNAETGHPSVLMYLTTFRANDFAKGAAIAVVLFLMAAIFIIPYLLSSHRERRGR